MTIQEAQNNIEIIRQQISKIYKGGCVTNVVIDEELGNVVATINGKKNIDCGWVEDYTSWID